MALVVYYKNRDFFGGIKATKSVGAVVLEGGSWRQEFWKMQKLIFQKFYNSQENIAMYLHIVFVL